MKAMAPASKLGMKDVWFEVGWIFMLILTFSVSLRTTPCRKPVHQKERKSIRNCVTEVVSRPGGLGAIHDTANRARAVLEYR